jgi:putative ABC transport system permease protein
MFKSYLNVAWRNFKRNKIFSLINIVGLSAGLACCMLITLYILNELNYDKYHKNAQDIYQIGTVFIQQKEEEAMPNTPAPMGETMKLEFPEVMQSARLMGLFAEDKTLLQYRGNNSELKSFYEEKGYLADPSFFSIFTYNFIEGNAAGALNAPNTIVLSEGVAKKIFGNQPALNKTIRVSSSTNGDHDFLITGVFKPIGKPSHIDAKFFLSLKGGAIEEYMRSHEHDFASNNMFHTYLQLKPGSDAQKLQAKVPFFHEKICIERSEGNGL